MSVKLYPAEFLYAKPVSYMEQPNYANTFWSYLGTHYTESNRSSIESFLPQPKVVNYSGNLTTSAPAGVNKLVGNGVNITDHSNPSDPNHAMNSVEAGMTGTVVGKCAEFNFVTIVSQGRQYHTGRKGGFAYASDRDASIAQYGRAVNIQWYKKAVFSGNVWNVNTGGCFQYGHEYRGSQTVTYNEETFEWELKDEDDTVERRAVARQGSGYDSECGDIPSDGDWSPLSPFLANSFLGDYFGTSESGENVIGDIVTLSQPFSNDDYLQVGDDKAKDLKDNAEEKSSDTGYLSVGATNIGTLGTQVPAHRREILMDYIPHQAEWEPFERQDEEMNTYHYRGTGTLFTLKEANPRPLEEPERPRGAYMRIIPVFIGMTGTFRVQVWGWKRTAVWNFTLGQTGHENANTYGDWEAFEIMDQTHSVTFDQMHCGDAVEISNLEGADVQLETGYDYYFGSSPLDNFIVGAGQDMPAFVITRQSY